MKLENELQGSEARRLEIPISKSVKVFCISTPEGDRVAFKFPDGSLELVQVSNKVMIALLTKDE